MGITLLDFSTDHLKVCILVLHGLKMHVLGLSCHYLFFSFLHFSTLKLKKCKKLKKKIAPGRKVVWGANPLTVLYQTLWNSTVFFFFFFFFFVMFWRCACAFGLSSYFYLLFLWKSLGLKPGRCSRQKRERQRETETDRQREREHLNVEVHSA